MNRGPKVAFIIVCWNNQGLLADCLKSIQQQTYKNYKTIMVDNGSNDNSITTAQNVMPNIEIIATNKNNGFARGNNIGIQRALQDPEVELVSLVNSDARLHENWLRRVVDFSLNKPTAACLQGTTLDYYNKKFIDSTHLYVNHFGQAVQGGWKELNQHELAPKKVFGVNAAACAITRKFIEAQPFTNLFDETMFMYLEDVDLAVRATITGWDNYLVPGATAYHMGAASTGGDAGFSAFGLYMTFRNNLGMILKNFPWPLILKMIIKMPKTDYLTVKHLLATNNKTEARKVIAGRLVSLVRIPIYLLQRPRVRHKSTIDRNYLWFLMRQGY